jgi:gamma-glutamyltranspeptidase/glutathione hydrolase
MEQGAMKASWASIILGIAISAGGSGPAQAAAVGRLGMVATDQAQATRVGVAVLRAGGNAIDAAVAVGYALAVTDPCCGNIGGGGFMLIHRASGADSFINFRERAPLRARANMYLDARGNVVAGRSTAGWLAVGVPGTVAGLERARTEYGTRSRADLLAPAIALARDGFVLSPGDIDMLRLRTASFARQPNVAAIFMRNGAPLQAGLRLRQPQLARTLSAVAQGGAAEYYRGSIARRVVAAGRRGGSILSLADFARYTTEELRPVVCRYRSFTIVSAPPPSSGGTTLCEILRIVDADPFARWGHGSPAAVAADVEAERLAYADRNTYLGDPDFVRNPVARLLAPAYIAKERAKIGPRAGDSRAVRGGLGPPEHAQTTHYSIVDRYGNAVAVTYTINDNFGAGIIAGDTGFFLNDEMDDFTSKPGVPNLYGLVQGSANAIAPGKRPLSSMAPTIALRDGRVAIVAGSPGGSRIITITLGILQDLIDFRMSVGAAVAAPRFHHQWLPDVVEVEPGAINAATRTALRTAGYSFASRAPWGAAEVIAIDPRTGIRYGASDPRRRSGLALGY